VRRNRHAYLFQFVDDRMRTIVIITILSARVAIRTTRRACGFESSAAISNALPVICRRRSLSAALAGASQFTNA
jgi:hypothetical protein